jgi:hypothetical protein
MQLHEIWQIHGEIVRFIREGQVFEHAVDELLKPKDKEVFQRVLTELPIKSAAVARKTDQSPDSVSRAIKRISDAVQKVSVTRGARYPIYVAAKVGEEQTGVVFHCGEVPLNQVEANLAGLRAATEADVEPGRRARATDRRVYPVGGPEYLQSAEGLLKIGDPPEAPKWFRKTGPIAVDFVAGVVCRPKKMRSKLKKKLDTNPACVLEGGAATGKTVLVRDLVLALRKDHAIYYFSCHQPGGFDAGELATRIKGVTGIVIMEDIHLCPQQAQQVYSYLYPWLRNDPDNHILFVGRSSFREGENAHLAQRLDNLPALPLTPFSDADAIIQQYIDYQAIHKPSLAWPADAVREIRDRSGQNYWLLAYALEGYVKAEGKGEPGSWIEAGVTEDLHDLKHCGDPHAARYPEVVVALSSLYRNEVMTAEDYLRDKNKLNIDPGALEALVVRGEITRDATTDGDVFYGLPHSSLAGAYWQHGRQYLKNKDLLLFEHFIVDYAQSDVSNVLAAYMMPDVDVESFVREGQDRITAGLEADGTLTRAIERERSPDAVEAWFRHTTNEILAKHDVLAAVVRRMESAGLWRTLSCLFIACYADAQIGRVFWSLVNQNKLRDGIARAGFAGPWLDDLVEISHDDRPFAQEVLHWLTVDAMVAGLNREPSAGDVGRCLDAIENVDSPICQAIVQRLDKEALANKLSDYENVAYGRECIDTMFYIDPTTAFEVCERLRDEKIVRILKEEDAELRESYLMVVEKANPQVGERLRRLVGEDRSAGG